MVWVQGFRDRRFRETGLMQCLCFKDLGIEGLEIWDSGFRVLGFKDLGIEGSGIQGFGGFRLEGLPAWT